MEGRVGACGVTARDTAGPVEMVSLDGSRSAGIEDWIGSLSRWVIIIAHGLVTGYLDQDSPVGRGSLPVATPSSPNEASLTRSANTRIVGAITRSGDYPARTLLYLSLVRTGLVGTYWSDPSDPSRCGPTYLTRPNDKCQVRMPSEDNDLHNEPDSADAEAEVDGPLLVSFSGELDISTVEAVRERLERRELLDATAVHVDLTEVTFIDSSTIGLLVSACNRIRGSGGAFSVRCDIGTTVRRTLEVSGVIEYLEAQ